MKDWLPLLTNAMVVLLVLGWIATSVFGVNREVFEYLRSVLPEWVLIVNLVFAPLFTVYIVLYRKASGLWNVFFALVFIVSYTLLQAAASEYLLPAVVAILVVWVVSFVPTIRRSL